MEVGDLAPGFAFLNVLLDPPHIWIVASKPNTDGEVVLFMLSSRRPGADMTCIVSPESENRFRSRYSVAFSVAR